MSVGCFFNVVHDDWTIIASVYYWIVTFTTVGFGDIVEPIEVQVNYIVPLELYRIFGLTLLAGVIDSTAAWLKKRKNTFKLRAEKSKSKIVKYAFLEWLDNASVDDGIMETSRTRRRSVLSLPTAPSVNDLTAIV